MATRLIILPLRLTLHTATQLRWLYADEGRHTLLPILYIFATLY